MRAIILAAGRGSRMGELTKEQPKCLATFKGKPLIEHQISALSDAGIKDIAIVTGYKSSCLQKYGTQQFFNPKWEETNMVHSLFCAAEWLQSYDCIISYGDIIYESQVVRDLMRTDEEITIAYDPNWLKLWSRRFANPLDDAETFRIDDKGFLLEIGMKPKTTQEVQGQYMGLLKFKKEFWQNDFSATPAKCDMTTFLANLLMKGKPIRGVQNLGYWGEFDSISDLEVGSENNQA